MVVLENGRLIICNGMEVAAAAVEPEAQSAVEEEAALTGMLVVTVEEIVVGTSVAVVMEVLVLVPWDAVEFAVLEEL